MSVNAEQKCSECGGLIPAGAAHCPACMLGRAMGGEDSLGDLPGETTSSLDGAPVTEVAGDSIGAYKLLEKIGEGGFGVVYMAKQEAPVRRQVALKIVKLGMDTKQVVGRFEVERQALAMMEHPSIAKVLDAGSTETGRPYFVMELVHGVPITEFCNENRLTTEERLKLFVKVCHAVQHAHQKGVIHRDLKPSNILVTMHDDEAVPKVIDFGIAKATQHDLTDKTLFTQFRHFLGTPAYMSPEQAQMSGLGVDTRSDIYSLGVLLYELLTGCTPLDLKPAMESGYDAVRQTIREVEPMKPSTRVSQLSGVAQTTLSKQSRSNTAVLQSQLRGDLDWIVMKAIEKDRTRRYGTAELFARDVAAFLRDDPVSAVAPSPWYLLGKLAKRNKPLFVSVGLSFPALFLAAVFSFLMWGQERKAKLKSDDLQKNLEKRLEQELQLGYARDVGGAAELVEDGKLVEAARLLDRHIPNGSESEESVDRREFAWHYLKAQTARSGSLALPPLHKARPMYLAFSPDGRRLVSATHSGEVFLWDVLERRLVDRLERGSKSVDAGRYRWGYPSFSSDGRYLIYRETPVDSEAVEDLEVVVWELVDGQYLQRDSLSYSNFAVDGKRNVSRAVKFLTGTHRVVLGQSPRIGQSGEYGVLLYDLDAREEVWFFEAAGTILDVSPDGKRLVTRRWLREEPDVVVWDLNKRSLLVRNPRLSNVSIVTYADADWMVASDPITFRRSILHAETLELGPEWLSHQLDGSPLGVTNVEGVYWISEDYNVVFSDARNSRKYGVEGVGFPFEAALHPEGNFFASGNPNPGPGRTGIYFTPIGGGSLQNPVDLSVGRIVFGYAGDEALVNVEGRSAPVAYSLPRLEESRDLGFDGEVLVCLSDDEVYFSSPADNGDESHWIFRTGDRFAIDSVETPFQVKKIFSLRSGNLLFCYRDASLVEVRDRDSLEVLESDELGEGINVWASRSSLAKSEDIVGLRLTGEQGGFLFLRAETLEPIESPELREDDNLVDLTYLENEQRFVFFYRSGWVEELSVPSMEAVAQYRLANRIEYAAISHDGLTIALSRIRFPRVELFCRRTQARLMELPVSAFAFGWGLKFSPANDALFVVPSNLNRDFVMTWWSAGREAE